jgi:hypothetical protein
MQEDNEGGGNSSRLDVLFKKYVCVLKRDTWTISTSQTYLTEFRVKLLAEAVDHTRENVVVDAAHGVQKPRTQEANLVNICTKHAAGVLFGAKEGGEDRGEVSGRRCMRV